MSENVLLSLEGQEHWSITDEGGVFAWWKRHGMV
jgi:hypothetical protein